MRNARCYAHTLLECRANSSVDRNARSVRGRSRSKRRQPDRGGRCTFRFVAAVGPYLCRLEGHSGEMRPRRDSEHFGRRTSISSAEPIERHHWAHLALCPGKTLSKVIATYPSVKTKSSFASRMVTSWGWLRLLASDVQNVWPSTTPTEFAEQQKQRSFEKPFVRGRPNSGGAQRIDDSAFINELHEAKASGKAKSIRDEVLARASDIKGASPEAKVRRLTRKYKKAFGEL